MIKVTCRTDGCINENIAIPFETIGDTVVCGPCGVVITDIVTDTE
jgi:hypothetical protein